MGRALVGMYSGTFQRCLRQLNPKLRICCLNNSSHAAGIYYIDPEEGYVPICGVDKGFVPVATTVDEVGHILKSGWYRVVCILMARGLTSFREVQRVWPNFFLSRIPAAEFQNIDPLMKKMSKFVFEEADKRGEGKMTADQILEVAADIHKKDSEAKKAQDDKAKWELNKALDKDQKIYL